MEKSENKLNSFLLGLSITLGTIVIGLISYIFFTSNIKLPWQEEDRCEYGGWAYAHGETFDSTDGCNICVCNDGVIACTERACEDPSPEDLN